MVWYEWALRSKNLGSKAVCTEGLLITLGTAFVDYVKHSDLLLELRRRSWGNRDML